MRNNPGLKCTLGNYNRFCFERKGGGGGLFVSSDNGEKVTGLRTQASPCAAYLLAAFSHFRLVQEGVFHTFPPRPFLVALRACIRFTQPCHQVNSSPGQAI
jgi:hypothetical protein